MDSVRNHCLTKYISVQRVKVTGKTVELYKQTTQMGLSYQWYFDCDEQSAWCDNCVCISGNALSRNEHSNAPVIHRTPSEYSYSTNSGDNGSTANEEEGIAIISQ